MTTTSHSRTDLITKKLKIMTPKEKAEELVTKMLKELFDLDLGVRCALIAVEELINLDYNSLEYYGILSSTDYWIEVKQEIENL